jgi:hypothetical protein
MVEDDELSYDWHAGVDEARNGAGDRPDGEQARPERYSMSSSAGARHPMRKPLLCSVSKPDVDRNMRRLLCEFLLIAGWNIAPPDH